MQRVLGLLCPVWQFAASSLLIGLWAIWFAVFCNKMLPRFGYLIGYRLIGNDPPCAKPECDFSEYWRAGLTARLPAGRLANVHLLLQPGVAMPLPDGYRNGFPYPPPMLLPTAAISRLPFEWGYFVWISVGLVLAVLLLRWARLPWAVILAGLLSPAALWNTELGQMGMIGGALLFASYMRLETRPATSGALLGLLFCKPQTGIIVPAALGGQRNWRGATAFFGTCAALFLITCLCFGWPVWQAYMAGGRQGGLSVLNLPFNPSMAAGEGVSVYWMLDSLHAPPGIVIAGQLTCTAAAMAVAAWLAGRRNLPRTELAAMLVFLSLLATPYGYTDDMVAYSIALAALAERNGWRIGMLDALFWLWPAFCEPASEATGVLWTPCVTALALTRAWHRAGLPLPGLPGPGAVLARTRKV